MLCIERAQQTSPAQKAKAGCACRAVLQRMQLCAALHTAGAAATHSAVLGSASSTPGLSKIETLQNEAKRPSGGTQSPAMMGEHKSPHLHAVRHVAKVQLVTPCILASWCHWWPWQCWEEESLQAMCCSKASTELYRGDLQPQPGSSPPAGGC